MTRIAIIGAGVSGLTTAWYLRKKFPTSNVVISVYDSSLRVGGNANTMDIFLKDGSSRWADMGVNDFNKATYKSMVALWTELGIINTHCKPLINEESFWKGGTSSYKYWVDGSGNVNKPDTSPAKIDIIETQLKFFRKELSEWYKSTGYKDPEMTVGKWVEGKFDREFIDNNLYPRINGMYYAREQSTPNVPPPSLMPLWMVAHYYILQEGAALEYEENEEARQYFVGGSSRWLEELATRLIGRGVIISEATMGKTDLLVHQDQQTKQFFIKNGTSNIGTADICIFATHANVTKDLIKFDASSPEDLQMINALTDFKYDETAAWAFSHQDPSALPGDGCDKTYNIHIYDYSKAPEANNRWPYTITYIENYHQKMNPVGPLFYTTLNPFIGRAPSDITKQRKDGSQAITTFWHCRLDKAAMLAQIKINDIQILAKSAAPRSFYFAGSFTIGAGLHEECIRQAIAIADKIANPMEGNSDNMYNFEGNTKDFAPKYMLDAIRLK